MIELVFAIHVVGLVGAAIAGRRSIQGALRVAAIAPAATTIWAAESLLSGREPVSASMTWVEQLDLELIFLADSFALMMTLLVSGIGALVFVYASGYFAVDARGSIRFPVTLLGFSVSMLGLVLAESVWTVFIFWEFTSITSFLLVGHKLSDPSAQQAAWRALMITGAGGLSLLAGLLVLTDDVGSVLLADIAGSQTASPLAAVLVLIAVGTKSAQLPFHSWLPGAMAAPTPVSAYLHSATMVKAGVVVMAVLGGAFVDSQTWQWLGLIVGAATTLWGGFVALRQRDLKLILAYGTISQLGLLVTLLAVGTSKAVFAALSIVVAHALFKSALFLVVGEIDIRTGTRNLDELAGLHRSMPVAFVVAVLAGVSMAGIPPLLGFAAKEAAVEAVLKLSGIEQVVAFIGIVGGSVLTVAYTFRMLAGLSRSPEDGRTITALAFRPAMAIPSIIVAGLGLVGFVLLGTINGIVTPAATELNAGSAVYELLRWPGATTALMVSAAVVLVGSTIGAAIHRSETATVLGEPEPVAARVSDASIDGVLRLSRRVTARVQHGSLPVYLLTMSATVVIAAAAFLPAVSVTHLEWAETPVQLVLGLAIAAAAAAGVQVRTRLGAALTLGAVGVAMSGLFILQGAPDLALTQLLVETIVVVGFVTGLGHLARTFPPVTQGWLSVRLGVAVMCGLGVVGALAASSAQPSGSFPAADLLRESVETGGGNNIVNVILTDMRALDTLGEVVVLAVVAVGVIALARTSRSPGRAQ